MKERKKEYRLAVVGREVAGQSRESQKGWHLDLTVETHIGDIRRGHIGRRHHLARRIRHLDVHGHEVTHLAPDITDHTRGRHILQVTGQGHVQWRKSHGRQHV